METVLTAIADWIKGILTAGIMSNLSGLFDDVNTQVGNIAQQVGTKPSSFEPRVFAMIEALSRNVVLPIAGIILTFIACYELIEMITQHNNMAQFEPALIMRWIFKTAVSVWLISNTFDIVMAVFDITQKVVSDSSGIIAGNTRVNDIGLSMLEASLMQMDVANGSIMMCEVQGAKEDFIRRWDLVFKDYPDVFEDNNCRSAILFLIDDTSAYLQTIKERVL